MFTTPVKIPRYGFAIDHSQRGLLLGSCFAEEIGKRLIHRKFYVNLNPHGIVFNPASVNRVFRDSVSRKQYSVNDLVEHGGLWHSMQHHGIFSDTTAESTLAKINKTDNTDFDYIIVTLGSAWVYEYGGEIVANCHKLPTSRFIRRRLSVDECVNNLTSIAKTGVPVILTVSPVRHIKDGLAENSLSKSILRVAASELAENYGNVHYFPSFEIFMDELRDYRYYADDMIHPSGVAAEHVWRRFSETFFDSETVKLNSEIVKIQASLSHRPLHPNTEEYRKFRDATQETIAQLAAKYPGIDFSEEMAHVRSIL